MSRLLLPRKSIENRRANLGFEFLSFENCRLSAREKYKGKTENDELAIVLLGGVCSVESTRGNWGSMGGRKTVFDGMPFALYLPIHTDFTISSQSGCDIALCFSSAEEEYPARLVTPDKVAVEIRGGGNATRQINSILGPEFPAHRLIVVEVYTPAGNWSSFPPHKHDVHSPPGEVDLEEIYYYRVQRPEGFAVQRVYTSDRTMDETLTVRDGEMVLVPEGYHPVAAAHGYNIYYLNALAGSARSLAASDDPDLAWVRNDWTEKDPRVPLVRL